MPTKKTPPKKNLFCALAWIHSFVNLGGEYQVCCTGEEFQNEIVGDDGRPFNILDGLSPDQVMNATGMRHLRQMMLAGKWHPVCKRCKITETMGGVSRRMIENGRYADLTQQLTESTRPDGSIPVKILSADYRLGNLCNIQCRMCNPRASIRWFKDWEDMKPFRREVTSDAAVASGKAYDWINDPALVKEFEQKAPHLRHLHFAGGEPLITPQMKSLLQKCVDAGTAGNIELTFNTNVTKLPEDVISLWSHFKEVRLLCSVDGYGALNDYIRTGSNWASIDRNLRMLDARKDELHIGEILISTTVQAYNVLYLDRLVEYLGSGFQHVIKFPNLVSLMGPPFMSTQTLPANLKKEATERLIRARDRAAAYIPSNKGFLLENATQSINFMNAADRSDDYGKFLEYTQVLDTRKKQSLASTCPELNVGIPFPRRAPRRKPRALSPESP